MRRTISSLIWALWMAPPTLAAQSAESTRPGVRPILPRAEEIALARSAAPPEVSGAASVLVLERGKGYVPAETGTNGVTCYVSRSQPEAIEPHCFDREGSETILQMDLREAELREWGKSEAEIKEDIAEGLRMGRFRLPRRPAMSYMMSAAQVLYNEQGERAGQWQPHLMIYVPYLTAEDLGLGSTPSFQAAVVVDPGKPTANIMIVVKDFVEPARR